IAGDKGLHRHVIGGSAVEQVIDASLSSFGNPSRPIVHAMELENEEFLAQFEDGSLIKFYYDATVPTVPNDKLVLYSLEDNDTVRQAIAAYQTANPGMFVEYEVALEGDGVTREDALKNLSTRLLNGEGPDILLLNDMPIDTYVEKGILLDMSDVIEEVKSSDGLYENLITPFMQDGSIYVTPIEFQLPLIMGEREYVEKSKNYKGYAQSIVELRTANPEGMIILDCNETGIAMRYMLPCAAAWKNEDGSINEGNIREFLELTKMISDAQMSGISQKNVSDYSDLGVFRYNDGSDGQFDWGFYFKMIDAGSFMQNGCKMASGNVYSTSSLSEALSMPKNEGCENLSVSLFDGQSKNVYMPETLTGINAQSKNTEAAKSFVKLMLSQEVQTSTFRGLPINKAALETVLAQYDDTLEKEEPYMMYGGSDQEGNSWFWNAWWFDEEQKQLIRDWASQAQTPYIKDSVLEDAVQNACVEYLKGRIGLDAAVADIVKSTAIYMSE
ncbi:MAG: extracellular solute-binding protein, partial [Lachnospiraceae bacterium]|nr:extracellular solute-binding protein [Lachnospiraceae bacterium]